MKTINFDAELAKVERAYACVREPPVLCERGDETSWLFAGNLELRINRDVRGLTLRDHGIENDPGAIDVENPHNTEDVRHVAFWSGLQPDCCFPSSFVDKCDDYEEDTDEIFRPDPLDSAEGCAVLELLQRFRHAQLRAVRRVLVQQLPCAITTWLVRMRFPWLTFFDVMQLWKHFEEASSIADDNIKLLPVWLWSGEDLVAPWEWDEYWKPGTSDPFAVRSLCERLRDLGVPPRIWRMLCRFGPRLLPVSVSSLWPTSRLLASLRYLRLLAVDGFNEPPSQIEKRALWDLGSLADYRGEFTRTRTPALLRAAVRHVRQQHVAGKTVEVFGMIDAISELCSSPITVDANQGRAGWNWWLRQYRLRKALRDEVLRRPWPFLVGAFKAGPYTVVPLCDQLALHEEGDRMHNCLSAYADMCATQGLRMYSIRRSEGARPLATVALQFSNGIPRVLEAASFANGPVPTECDVVIAELLDRYRRA